MVIIVQIYVKEPKKAETVPRCRDMMRYLGYITQLYSPKATPSQREGRTGLLTDGRPFFGRYFDMHNMNTKAQVGFAQRYRNCLFI